MCGELVVPLYCGMGEVHKVLCGRRTIEPRIRSASRLVKNHLLVVHVVYRLFRSVDDAREPGETVTGAGMLDRFDAGDQGVRILGPNLSEKRPVSRAELLLRRVSEGSIVRSEVDRDHVRLPALELPAFRTASLPSGPVLPAGPFPRHHDAGGAVLQDRDAGLGDDPVVGGPPGVRHPADVGPEDVLIGDGGRVGRAGRDGHLVSRRDGIADRLEPEHAVVGVRILRSEQPPAVIEADARYEGVSVRGLVVPAAPHDVLCGRRQARKRQSVRSGIHNIMGHQEPLLRPTIDRAGIVSTGNCGPHLDSEAGRAGEANLERSGSPRMPHRITVSPPTPPKIHFLEVILRLRRVCRVTRERNRRKHRNVRDFHGRA
mmetsp:Transcript_16951/g.33754  ORF Transcript_16951/g.33754 Transcript_16951/m.33754 type:complete len:373 (-) Transcript_16951:24-1142(-)